MEFKMNNLGDPLKFWKYFEGISKIPRCSGNEEQIGSHIEEIARSFHYKTKIDKVGNLLVYKPPNRDSLKDKKRKKIIFQAHLDMVCEKNKEVSHDFSKDALSLQMIKEEGEKWLTADGTTLGADNGVGIAYCLTLMNYLENKKLEFNNIIINFLFTVEEEVGLNGAFNINHDFIEGDFLINLDSEDDNKFTIGCAGGITTTGTIKLTLRKVYEFSKELIPIKLTIKGLIGGHSGVDINKGRANAIKIISKILWKVNNKYGIFLSSLNGGNLSNAIPREAEACFYCKKDDKSAVLNFIDQIKSEIKMGISKIEPDMKILSNVLERSDEDTTIQKEMGDKLLHLLYVMPNGPISIHPENPDLVYTSTNLASIEMYNANLEIVTSQRSLHEISKIIIYEKIEALFKLADLNIEISHNGDYPSWEPYYDSTLLEIAKKSYKNLFHSEPVVQTIHAGLETGILNKKFPEIEMISLGPNIQGGHSPDEKLHVKSVEKIWKLLIELLTNLDTSN
jgi:dipeptidase D